MKKKIIIFTLMIISVSIISIMTGFTNNVDKKEVEELLVKRTDILQNVLLNKISEEEGKKSLRKIETGKIYIDDCKLFETYENSDYDIVIDMKLKSIEQKSKVSDITTYLATIEWTTFTYEGINYDQLTHYIGIKDCGEINKIVTFEPVENKNLL